MRRRYDFSPDMDSQIDYDAYFDRKVNRNSVHSVPYYVGLIVGVYLLVLYSSVYFIDNSLPKALKIVDEQNHPDAFIAERAINDLKLLTDLGPRVVGSYENEVAAVAFLKQQIENIINKAHPNQTLELDHQIVSGAYALDLTKIEKINVYANVQNIVVKVHGTEGLHSILINSHFDSVPTSPGGSDDGINVVAMLEILRKISKSANRPLHNIIFLFNGAEESPLQASHGFITQHRWAKQCKVAINLEACGAGGKIILFQTGPEAPWLMNYYAKVPHPYGQAAGEEIFQTGLIPSDTDFRIFRDYGSLVGMDMAFFKNGYRYHTKYDNYTNIPPGSYQHVGDNALSLVINLANAPEISRDLPRSNSVVYFDFLGWFMVSYTMTIANIVNLLTVTVSFYLFICSLVDSKVGFSSFTVRYLLLTFGSLIGGWLLAISSVLLIGYVLDYMNRTMSWYANPPFVVGLYAAPTVILSSFLLFFTNHENLSVNIRCQIQAHLLRLIWTIFLLAGTLMNIRSVYALMVPVLFNSLGFLVIYLLHWTHTRRKWLVVYLISLIIPTVCLMYQTNITLAMFIPLTGRIGSDKNPEFIVGIMTAFFTILITSPYVILVNLLRNAKYFVMGLMMVFLAFFAVTFTPLGFPYKGDIDSPAPERYWMWHTSRNIYNASWDLEKTDAGYFLLNMDRNSPKIVEPFVTEIRRAQPIGEYCDKLILCGLPISHAKMSAIIEHSTWIPANQPIIPNPVKLTLNSKDHITSSLTRYNVTITGPDRMGVYLVPNSGMALAQISLAESVLGFTYRGQKLYFIHFVSAKDPGDLTFVFDIEVPSGYSDTSVEVVVTGNYVHTKGFVKTPYYAKLIESFPKWADVTAGLGVYSSYIL